MYDLEHGRERPTLELSLNYGRPFEIFFQQAAAKVAAEEGAAKSRSTC